MYIYIKQSQHHMSHFSMSGTYKSMYKSESRISPCTKYAKYTAAVKNKVRADCVLIRSLKDMCILCMDRALTPQR